MAVFINQNFEGTGFDNGETWITYAGDTGAANPDYSTNPLLGSHSLHMKDDDNEGTYAVNIFSDGAGVNALYGFFRIKFLDFVAVSAVKEVMHSYNTSDGGVPREIHEIIFHEVHAGPHAHLAMVHPNLSQFRTGTFEISLNTVYYVWFYISRNASKQTTGWVKISASQSIPASNDMEWSNVNSGDTYQGTGAIGFTTEHGTGYEYLVDQVYLSDTAINNDLFETTEIIRIVDPDMGSGYDYDSLSDWEADLGDTTSGDLPAYNEIAVAKCRCTGGTADSTAVAIDGWTTDSTHYIKIWTDPSESYRHSGKWSTGNKYRLDVGTSYDYCILPAGYVKIIGLQFRCNHASNQYTVMMGYAASTTTIESCVIHNTATPSGFAAGIVTWTSETTTLYLINTVVILVNTTPQPYGFGLRVDEANHTWYVYNCTLAGAYGIYQTNSSITAKNTFAVGISDPAAFYYANGTFSLNYCASYDSSAEDYGGTGNIVNATTVAWVDAVNGDFHLLSTDTVLKGKGTNLYNDANYPFQTDIDGDDRGGSGAEWDIGADEYIDSYQLPVNRQYIRGATATWYEVVDVYVLKDGVFVPDKLIKILDSGSWI